LFFKKEFIVQFLNFGHHIFPTWSTLEVLTFISFFVVKKKNEKISYPAFPSMPTKFSKIEEL